MCMSKPVNMYVYNYGCICVCVFMNCNLGQFNHGTLYESQSR